MPNKKRGHDGLISEKNEEEAPQSKKSGRLVDDDKRAHLKTMDRTEEMDMVKKILTKVVASVPEAPSDDEEVVEALESERPTRKKQAKSTPAKDPPAEKVVAAENGKPAEAGIKTEDTEPAENEMDSEESKLSRTCFIRNLPPDAKVPELRKLFAEFGVIKSFRLVLHPVTKYDMILFILSLSIVGLLFCR